VTGVLTVSMVNSVYSCSAEERLMCNGQDILPQAEFYQVS
jgi:hypothetical protein